LELLLGIVLSTVPMLLAQSREDKGEVVNVGNLQEKTILERATKIKE